IFTEKLELNNPDQEFKPPNKETLLIFQICPYYPRMDEYEYNRAMNYSLLKSFGTMNMTSLSANVSPKLSARNSYTGSSDSADDFSDVFGGPPKYISLKQFKDPRKAHSLLQPLGGFSGPVQSEVPVFGETRKRYVNDEFYNDIFNGDTVSSGGEMSDKCSVASKSTSRNASPSQSPLPRTDYKGFGNRSPLAPKLRQPVNSSKISEYSSFGTFSQHGPYKSYNDSSVVSSAQSTPPDPSSDLLEIPFAHCSKPPKIFAESKHGLKKQQEFGVFPPRSSNSRFRSFLEPGESKSGSPARLSNDKLYSTAQTTSCSNTSDDELGGNIQGYINEGVSKLAVVKHGSDNAKGSNPGEKNDNGFEKSRLSASDGSFHRLAVSPREDLQLQHKLRSCRDWFPEHKGLSTNKESGSLSMGSSGFPSTREIHSNVGISNVKEVSQEIGPKRLSTNGIDSGEESDELGSYVIEIDTKRGEALAFLPERDIQIDTINAQNPLISSIKETMESTKEESLPNRPMKHMNHDAKGSKLRLQSLLQKTYNFDPLSEAETKMQALQTNKGKGRGRESSKMPPNQHIPEISAWSAATSAVEQGTKEDLMKETKMATLWDPYSIDPLTMVREVSDRIEKWHHDQPVVFREMPLASERRNDSADSITEKETPENRRKRFEKERHLRTKECMSKILVEKKQKELEIEEEETEKTKSSEKLDSEIKRWSTGKEGNIRALLSTLQYVLWPGSGWKPVPLIEIIEGIAVKKAYQKARLCVHPDKLQQKGASVQQKYIAEKVFNILQ
ncbi:hypothetical protein KI387_022524, partial [Taxus chinensis]